MSSAAETRAVTVGKWLLAFVVPVSALAVGSLLPSVLAAMTLVAAVACGLLWSTPPNRTSQASRWIIVALGVFIGATLVQCIPLPAQIVRFIAPANAEVWERVLSPLHEPGPTWHPISVAPSATQVELLRGLFYSCVFLAGLRVASLEGGSAFLVRMVVGAAVAMALSALAHPAVSATKVFGIYKPRDLYAYAPGYYGPLLNTNHLAAYLNAGACVALGATLSSRGALPKTLSGAAALLLAGTSVWAGSRGGTAALVLGLAMAGGATLYSRRKFSSAATEATLIVVLVVAAAGLVGLGTSEVARGDLASADTSKLAMARTAFTLTSLSPLVGFGRGSFETIFPFVKDDRLFVTFTHPENVVVQWCVEWGFPVALAGAVALYAALRPSNVLRAARPEIGAWAALVAVAVHDLVDFHLEVPGIVALLCICAALVVGGRSRSSAPAPSRLVFRGSVPVLAFVSAASALAMALFCALHVPRLAADERELLNASVLDRSVPSTTYLSNVRASMLRYPAEPFFPLMGGVRVQLDGRESVVPWIGRALERSPNLGRAHLVLARSLAAKHRSQARLEYRLAIASEPGLTDPALTEAVRLVDGYDDALELVPEGVEGNAVLESLSSAILSRAPSSSARLDDELLRRDPTARGPILRRSRAVLVDIANDPASCDGDCLRQAIDAARRLSERDSASCEAHIAVARLRLAAGEAPGALDSVESAIDAVADRRACMRAFVEVLIQAHQRGRAEVMLDRVQRAGCGGLTECRDLYAWCGDEHERLGNVAKALSLYRRAAEIVPDDEAVAERLAALAARSGMFGLAKETYERLALRHPDNPRWRALGAEMSTKLAEFP